MIKPANPHSIDPTIGSPGGNKSLKNYEKDTFPAF
jgi:hypothetical protein